MSRPTFPPLRAKPVTMKSILASKTVIGIAVAMIAKLIGAETDEVTGIVASLTTLWPVLLGLGADVAALIARVKATDFDKTIFQSRTFWLQIVSGIATLVAAFGYDLTGFEELVDKGLAAWPAIAALAGSLFAIFGRMVARQKLRVAAPNLNLLP